MIRIVLVDDHTLIRDGVRRVVELHHDLEVVGEATCGQEALELLADAHADVVVLDLSLPDIGGVELVRRLSASRPELAVVVLTMYPEDQLAGHLFQLGVRAYLSKSRSSDELIDAIRAVHTGERLLLPGLEGAGLDPASDGRLGDPRPPHERLSAREYQVFLCLIQGRTVSEVAYELELSLSTISNHIAGIRAKLGVASIGEILRYANRVGLLQ